VSCDNILRYQVVKQGYQEDKTINLPFIVFTRFGLGIEWDAYYESRLALFEAITLPSLAQQTNSSFLWIILADARAPDWTLRRLAELLYKLKNAYLISVDTETSISMRVGAMAGLHDIGTEILLREGIVKDVGAYYLTTIIDDDDAWHRDVAATALKVAMNHVTSMIAWERTELPSSHEQGFVLSHSDGLAFSFPNGLMWFPEKQGITSFHYPFIGCSCFVLTRFSSGISVLSSRHGAWVEFAKVSGFIVNIIEVEFKAYLYTKHWLNTSLGSDLWKDRSVDTLTQDQSAMLTTYYGVIPDKANQAVASMNSLLSDSTFTLEKTRAYRGHTNDILGLQFLISALSRQEKVLKSVGQLAGKPWSGGTTVSLADVQERKRKLIELRRKLAQSPWHTKSSPY
jgi:hypothetical protein